MAKPKKEQGEKKHGFHLPHLHKPKAADPEKAAAKAEQSVKDLEKHSKFDKFKRGEV